MPLIASFNERRGNGVYGTFHSRVPSKLRQGHYPEYLDQQQYNSPHERKPSLS
ncbi:rCG20527, isoform CRA_a [Rattus norvegicus]|uniref:RCG20527, isoform CRA_a n=1 Tax=Rattus norvegicus TaxID=10116 RepID=A6K5K5_RAT|nr:rCG20527, isoform CRA_a [Rattus norvegicus]EDL75196.1 rCG20527, isoform CRA_a [Rattus norvegicus]